MTTSKVDYYRHSKGTLSPNFMYIRTRKCENRNPVRRGLYYVGLAIVRETFIHYQSLPASTVQAKRDTC
jgi:hypothetical protein